jgi:hypothetical protein
MKRIFLALTFVAALAAAGLGMSSTATAGHGCYDDYYGGWYGYRSHYYPSYYSYYDYGPSFSYYRSHGHRSHHHGHHHHGHHGHGHSGLHFSIGF